MSTQTPIFEDRADAGRKLKEPIAALALENPVIVTIPPLGVPVACELAKALEAPLDLLVVLGLPAPISPEEMIGHVVGGSEPHIILDEEKAREFFIPPGYADQESRHLLSEAERIHQSFVTDHRHVDLYAQNVILVADADVPKAALKAAIIALKKVMPRTLTVAMPATTRELVDALSPSLDGFVHIEAFASTTEARAAYRVLADVPEEEVSDIVGDNPAA